MKKKIFIILTGVLVLSLVLVGVANAYQGPTLVLDGPSEPEEEDNDELICSGVVTHPVLKRLAANYDFEYADLVDDFCEYDLGVGEIKHALETAKIAEEEDITFEDEEPVTYESLLQMFIGGMDWGKIWQELGLIGFGGFDPEEDDDDMDEEDDDEEMNPICSPETDFEHPALLGLAGMYEGVTYEQLVTYFCEGFGVGEIKLALQTAEKTEDEEDLWSDYLNMRKGEEEMGWGEIWQALGLIGKDKDKDNEPGPENNGKPENHPGRGKGLDKKP